MSVEEPNAKVVRLPLSRERITDLVREIVEAGRVVIAVDVTDGKSPFRLGITTRTVDLCLREGYVIDEHARADEFGNWRIQIGRVCAGLDVLIDVAVEDKMLAPRLFVTAIRGDVINL